MMKRPQEVTLVERRRRAGLESWASARGRPVAVVVLVYPHPSNIPHKSARVAETGLGPMLLFPRGFPTHGWYLIWVLKDPGTIFGAFTLTWPPSNRVYLML